MSDYKQTSKISISSAVKLADSCCAYIEARRTDDCFNQLWQQTQDLASKLDLDMPSLPRKKCIPKKIDDGRYRGDSHESIETLYRMNFHETVDTVVTQIKLHFSENDLSPLLNIEPFF